MNYRKIRKNVKAVSPVISVLLMIAVAVAASLVTYAWVMGYMGFTTNKVGKAISIQSVNPDGKSVYVQNVGETTVTIEALYINGVDQLGTVTPASPGPGETATFGLTNTYTFAAGQSYTVKVTTQDGSFSEVTVIPVP
jgi:flagellin-like protein